MLFNYLDLEMISLFLSGDALFIYFLSQTMWEGLGINRQHTKTLKHFFSFAERFVGWSLVWILILYTISGNRIQYVEFSLFLRNFYKRNLQTKKKLTSLFEWSRDSITHNRRWLEFRLHVCWFKISFLKIFSIYRKNEVEPGIYHPGSTAECPIVKR